MIDVERVDYVRVPVRDIEKAKHFYGEVLGLEQNPNSPGDDWIEYEVGNVTLALYAPEKMGNGVQRAANGRDRVPRS